MKYLCLVLRGGEQAGSPVEERGDALVREHLEYDDALRKSGHFIVAEALMPVQTTTTVRVRNGKLSATDGPFAETKEQLTST